MHDKVIIQANYTIFDLLSFLYFMVGRYENNDEWATTNNNTKRRNYKGKG